jgi:2-polyprenyl-6-methoxyphenol hydroxylase-like FAD-dependent oxidoreductase
MYDVIVVGARSAGASTAMLLARKGHRVLLVDRARFPSDTPTGHYIHQPGTARLARWGLLGRIAATGCPPTTQITLDLGPFALTGCPPPAAGQATGCAPRQSALSQVLTRAAVEAGAELREGFSVQEFRTDGAAAEPGQVRVTGVTGRTEAGRLAREAARIVVGADGVHSRLARAVGAPIYNERPALTAAWWSYWSGVPVPGPVLCLGPRRINGAFPTNDGLTCVFVTVPSDEVAAIRGDIQAGFARSLDLTPRLAARVCKGRREERWCGNTETRGFFRRPYGPGWALVGDAGYHKDPITGQGISDAFRDAELLAEAIDDGLSGRRPMDRALAGYEQHRNAAVMPMYDFTCQLATLEPPAPELQQLLAALRGSQEETNRFLGVYAGTVPVPEFFAPENVARIIGGAREGAIAA